MQLAVSSRLAARRLVLAAGTVLVLPLTGIAQPAPHEPAPAAAIARSAAVAERDGALVGRGRDYEVLFEPGGVTFAAVAGVALHGVSARFALASVGRGGRRGAVDAVEPALDAQASVVRYARPAFVETYEMRADGVEQSFVFHELPSGEGDLVVRGRLESELAAVVDAVGDTLLLRRADGCGIRFSTVIGIDATGARARGALRHVGGELELVLPATFVDRAVLPLVLDPLIGAVIPMPTGSAPDWNPQVAYDPIHGVYLVAWERVLLSEVDIAGQLVRPDGTLLGGTIFIDDTSRSMIDPTVTSVGNGTFVVTFSEDQGGKGGTALFARSVDGATGGLSPLVTLASGGGNASVTSAIAAADPRGTGDVLFAWARFETGAGSGTLLRRGTAGPSSLTLASAVAVRQPALTAMRMATIADGHVLIVGERYDFSSFARREVVALALDSELRQVGSVSLGDPSYSQGGADVASDGQHWLVTYTQGERSRQVTTSPGNVLCQTVALEASGIIASPWRPIAAVANRNESSPRVAFTGDSYAVTYTDVLSAAVTVIDPFVCNVCEPPSSLGPVYNGWVLSALQGSPTRVVQAALAARTVAAGPGEALVAWTFRDPSSSRRVIRTQRFRADDGVAVSLGGGCGENAAALATCAVPGNGLFTHRVRNAPPLAAAFLALGVARLDLPCGTCQLVPDPGTGVIVPAGMTDARGNAALTTPMPASPSLVGRSFIDQWLLLSGSGACPLLLGEMSDAIRITIE